MKAWILQQEAARGRRLLGLRRAFNALVAGGGGGTNATLCHPEDPSGTLLRKGPYADAGWVSFWPVPNGAKVQTKESAWGFTKIQHEAQQGWVRTAYVTVDGAHSACAQPPPAAPAAAPAATFKVTTYNILTGGDSDVHNPKRHYWQNGSLSPFEGETTGWPDALWNHRRDLVVDALKSQGDDIVMLNECTMTQLRYIEEKMSYMQRAHYMLKVDEVDGSAILFKEGMWEVVGDTYGERIMPGYTQVVVAARLRHVATDKKVVAVSLHLKSGYGDQEALRCQQFAEAMRKVKEKFGTVAPFIVAGDLNSDYTASYARLVNEASSLAGAGVTLRNAALDVGMHDKPTYYFWHHSTFDYILVSSPQFTVKGFVTQEAGAKAPNKSQGSDHFPVTAELAF